MKNRMKALALDRKKNPITGRENLTIREELADCKAKVRQCESDMKMLGGSCQIQNKIDSYNEQIKKLEKELE